MEAIFVEISAKIGVKFYYTQKERDYAYKMQKFAHANGIGPAVFGKTRLKKGLRHQDSGRHLKWGYLTERVEKNTIDSDQLFELSNKMEKLGLSTADISEWSNVGLLNGEPVCIDFGPNSMCQD